MSGLRQFTPPSMKGLNFNIDADLNLGPGHKIFTQNVEMFGGGNIQAGGSGAGGVSLLGMDPTPGSGAGIGVSGWQEPGEAGNILAWVPNAAHNNGIIVFRIHGVTDTPYLDLLSNRITSLGQPTTDMDAAPVAVMWKAWTPTETWVTNTPASITKIGRYTQIGKVVYFEYLTVSSDSNATTGLSFTGLPGTMVTTINYATFSCWERAGPAGSTWYPCVAVLNKTTGVCTIANFTTATDAQLVWVAVQGHYEVS